MRFDPKTSILIILAAAFVSFLLSVSLWFGVIGERDREWGCSWACGCPRSWRSAPC